MLDDPDIALRFFLFVLLPALVALTVVIWFSLSKTSGGRRSRRAAAARAAPTVASPVPAAVTEEPSVPVDTANPPPTVPVPIIVDRRGEGPAKGDQGELDRRERTLAELRGRFDEVVGERSQLAEKLGASAQRVRSLEAEADQLRETLAQVRLELAERDGEIERLRAHEAALESLREELRGEPDSSVVAAEFGVPGTRAATVDTATARLPGGRATAQTPLLARDLRPGDERPLTHEALSHASMHFDGTTEPLVRESSFDGLSGAGFTIEMWVRPLASSFTGTLLSYVVARRSQLGLYLSPGEDALLTVHLDGKRTDLSSAIPLSLGHWQHLAVAWEGETGGLSIFVDGTEVFAGELARGAVIPSGGRLTVGQDGNPLWQEVNPEMSYRGDLAEVRIWRYVRTEQAIAGDASRRARGGPGATIWRVGSPDQAWG